MIIIQIKTFKIHNFWTFHWKFSKDLNWPLSHLSYILNSYHTIIVIIMLIWFVLHSTISRCQVESCGKAFAFLFFFYLLFWLLKGIYSMLSNTELSCPSQKAESWQVIIWSLASATWNSSKIRVVMPLYIFITISVLKSSLGYKFEESFIYIF